MISLIIIIEHKFINNFLNFYKCICHYKFFHTTMIYYFMKSFNANVTLMLTKWN